MAQNHNQNNAVRNLDDIQKHDNKDVALFGLYLAMPTPTKGAHADTPLKHDAMVVLSDGTEVLLEPLDSPLAKRSDEERERFNGKNVRVTGVIHRIMHSEGESLSVSCIDNISSIQENEGY
jgi:hypothetical protein